MKKEFDSELEISEAPLMAALGITRCTTPLPMVFTDPCGVPYTRTPDWLAKRRRWGCYFETKAYLNDQPDKATAAHAANNRQPGRSQQWHTACTSWSNSVANAAIVHENFGADNIVIVLPDAIFKLCGPKSKRHGKLPIATVTTLNRLKAAGIDWLKTSQLRSYISTRDVIEAWHEQHTPEPTPFYDIHHIWCRTAEQLHDSMEELKAEGYRLKRGSKTETFATMYKP